MERLPPDLRASAPAGEADFYFSPIISAGETADKAASSKLALYFIEC